MLELSEIERKLLFPGERIAPIDLYPSGNTGKRIVPTELFRSVFVRVLHPISQVTRQLRSHNEILDAIL